jgi:hypothetical protein
MSYELVQWDCFKREQLSEDGQVGPKYVYVAIEYDFNVILN